MLKKDVVGKRYLQVPVLANKKLFASTHTVK